jgi:hypothetical protein
MLLPQPEAVVAGGHQERPAAVGARDRGSRSREQVERTRGRVAVAVVRAHRDEAETRPQLAVELLTLVG